MKNFLIAYLIISPFFSYSQNVGDLFNAGKNIAQSSNQNKIPKRWFSNIEVEFGVNNEVTYDYSKYDSRENLLGGRSAELENKVFYGLLYNINYPILNKLTLGAVGGFQHQSQQSISALKLGGILRYHFMNYESVNINLMTAYNIALSEKIGSEMANVRLGLQFPVTRTDDFNINLNGFWDFNDYVFKESVFDEANERPGGMLFRSYGISLGIQF